ncbi:C2H2 type zinc finger domain-containing protein [Sporormia fimetaria CBS 119925]|uniref:C2H2 type zinc finger domain-containing protein n=1 Tax=Sporormia fimetaria CBS 119925 TaxID=1340428 RepID=A0A6A6VM25_9PLEO|nr:C2H2 type zinc finger domain-containing protein [Sporormia fimetaria CBS 119925]
MAHFLPPDAELAFLAQDDPFAQLYPSNSCQSPPAPSIVYSEPMQQFSHMPTFSQMGSTSMYSAPVEYMPATDSPYPPQACWPSQSPLLRASATFSSYPPLTGINPDPALLQDTGFPPYYSGATHLSRPHSPCSSITGGLGVPSTGDPSPPSSRSSSPSSSDLGEYGIVDMDGSWRCAYPGCTSKAVFTRGCDLRKHFKRHTKSFFCQHPGCPQSTGGGFSSKKDLARHEARHNPEVHCDWEGCDRLFSRVDNMRDHVKRIHLKGGRSAPLSRTHSP